MKCVEALILEKRSVGEADEILICYTKERGKIQIRARGVKKPSAKLGGSLQEFNWLKVYFVEGKSRPIVTDVALIESFSAIKASLGKLSSVQTVVKSLIDILPESGPDQLLWWQLTEYLKILEDSRGEDSAIKLAPVFFIYKMLNLHGFRPELNHCVGCRLAPVKGNKILFSTAAGGLLGQECFKLDPTAFGLSSEVLNVLKNWQKLTFKQFLSQPTSYPAEIIKLVENFSHWHLGVPLELIIS